MLPIPRVIFVPIFKGALLTLAPRIARRLQRYIGSNGLLLNRPKVSPRNPWWSGWNTLVVALDPPEVHSPVVSNPLIASLRPADQD
jgi:hypothetical protein